MPNPTCTVVYDNGEPCARTVSVKSKGLCLACSRWSRKNGGADPNGRSPRHLYTTRCPVVFADGTPCPALGGARKSPWCPDCYGWFQRNGGADPAGRPRRHRRGSVQMLLRAAASSTTDECIDYTGRSGRPNVELLGKFMNASRAVWIIANGDPGEDSVLHTCHRGEEGCINIRHLYLGDQKRNVHDALEADRNVRGERQWNSAVTEDDVCLIRGLLVEGLSHQEIADRMRVTLKLVGGIAGRRTWDYLKCCSVHSMLERFGRASETATGKASLTPERAEQARALVAAGAKQKDVAFAFGVSRMTISRLVRRQRYASIP